MAAKTDLKSLDSYKARSGAFRILEVPPTQYLMVDGHGDPNTSPEYSSAIESLFPVAYALKFASKQEFGRDYVVMPLEALWWAEDLASFTEARDKSQWSWTAMIMVPEWTTQTSVDAAVAKVAAKNTSLELDRLRFATLDEWTCVQTLHIGPYDDRSRDARIDARRLHSRQRSDDDRQTSRDLPQRCATRRALEAAHHPAATGQPAVGITDCAEA